MLLARHHNRLAVLDSTQAFTGPGKTFTRTMLQFPGIYTCAFYLIP
jgi:hypothetical protein